ncbi:MAG: helix-turn-helix transcriptional regulator [Clostridia bacterium]|nr:helix-turn-helix transcriptional regulator [Clostridia bacterium]
MENKFKDILKELRTERGIGQIELASRLKVSNGIISLWENGLREPNMSSLITIAEFFNVSIDYLVGREK